MSVRLPRRARASTPISPPTAGLLQPWVWAGARLAELAAGCGPVKKVCAAPPIVYTVDPDPALSDLFAARIVKYRALYRAL